MSELLARPAWQTQAACTPDMGPLFFPAPNDPGARHAKAVCAGCPVKAECLTHALDNDERGIWGGTSERQRRTMQREAIRKGAARANAVRCGTRSGYQRHRDRGEQACLACKEATAQHIRAYRARKAVA